MDLLSGLLSGQNQQEYEDFASRYEQGSPWDSISDDEAVDRYSQVATRVPPDVFQQSAQESFSRLSPQQRMELGQYLQQQAPQHGVQFGGGVPEDQLQDAGLLAQMTGQIHRQQPNLLAQILGGGPGSPGAGMGNRSGGLGGSMLASPIAKAALGGIAAMAVRRVMGGR
jgi:hypothetical protein